MKYWGSILAGALALLLVVSAGAAEFTGGLGPGPRRGGGGTIAPHDAIWINTPVSVVDGTPFTLSGGYSALPPADVLVGKNGGAGATCGAIISGGVWSCSYTYNGATSTAWLTASSSTVGDKRVAQTNTFVVSSNGGGGGGCSNSLDFSDGCNSQYLAMGIP